MKRKSNSICVTLGELAEKTQSELSGDGGIKISGAAPVDKAQTGDITFIANPRYLVHLPKTKASAVILDKDTPCQHLAVLRHSNPYLTFARVIDILYPDSQLVPQGIDSSTIVDESAEVAPAAAIGPLCHIKDGATVGKGSQLLSSVYVGKDASVGENCLIYPGVYIMDGCKVGNNVIIHSSTVIGSDGFGFAESPEGLKKIKQVGWVEIGDDVEIGSNCSVDRGTMGPTVIGRGTKIDNLVQIAHNVEIGNNSIIVSQVGISGSTRLGNGVILAGQVGIIGHLDIGDGVRVGAQSGVAKSIPAGKTVLGSPAHDIKDSLRIEAALSRLPELLKRVKKLESKKPD
ncbi:MAG: UDP-3-O-(3-hydroxymyristoyl)glucosamine N-acyltransferase [Candidatus Zixiibacteriota bacterium]|nr:MAG: UDP-3-O-(3-hydroxymyristoyl)glucosamine N-acyltransferase [candidate division Zixibacteria bacterium]